MTAPTVKSQLYDNTRLSEYKRCPRAFFIRHVLGWDTLGTGDALVFGSGWHAGQDIIWKHGRSFSPIDLAELASDAFMKEWKGAGYPDPTPFNMDRFGPRTPMVAKEMFFSYIEKNYRMIQNTEVLGIEQPFAIPMPGMRDTWYVGRLDKAVRYNGQDIILEHKTTAMYSIDNGFRPEYTESWYTSSQVKGYQFGGGLYYPNLSAVWVDCALVHKKVHNVFKFIPVAHNIELLTEWVGTAKTWAEKVTESKRQETAGIPLHIAFPKNEDSCFGKFGKCPFLDICRAQADPRKFNGIPPGYEYQPWEPFDLLGLDKLVKKVDEQ